MSDVANKEMRVDSVVEAILSLASRLPGELSGMDPEDYEGRAEYILLRVASVVGIRQLATDSFSEPVFETATGELVTGGALATGMKHAVLKGCDDSLLLVFGNTAWAVGRLTGLAKEGKIVEPQRETAEPTDSTPAIRPPDRFLVVEQTRNGGDTLTAKVRQHLAEGKHLTCHQAFSLYGSTRLSAIIYSLRERGMVIRSKLVEEDGRKQLAYYATGEVAAPRPRKKTKVAAVAVDEGRKALHRALVQPDTFMENLHHFKKLAEFLDSLSDKKANGA